MKNLITLITLVTVFTVQAQESVKLRLNYTPGDTYLVDFQSKQDMGDAGMMVMTMNMDMTIKSVADETFNTESNFSRIKMDMSQGGLNMSYDSNTKDEELDEMGKQMKAQMAPLLSAKVLASYDKRGNMLESKMEPMVPGMDQINNELGSINFPEEAVSVGSSWSRKVMNEGMEMNVKYTVNSIENGVVRLDISGDVSGVATGIISGMGVIKIDTGVTERAEVYVDLNTQGINVKGTTITSMTKK